MRREQRIGTVAALGSAQTLAWASSYYLPAMLAAPMARDIGISTPTVFAAFSMALVVSAFLGPYAGRAIDRWGGRPVLIGTNVVFALGLAGLGIAHSPVRRSSPPGSCSASAWAAASTKPASRRSSGSTDATRATSSPASP